MFEALYLAMCLALYLIVSDINASQSSILRTYFQGIWCKSRAVAQR